MFQYGDILAVVNQDDPNWWQARLAEEEGSEYTQAKLIPSRELEEKRKAFVKPEADYTTKVRQKYMYMYIVMILFLSRIMISF